MTNHEEIESGKRQWNPDHRKNHVARAPDLKKKSTGMVQFFDKERFAPSLDTETIALRGSGYVELLSSISSPTSCTEPTLSWLIVSGPS